MWNLLPFVIQKKDPLFLIRVESGVELYNDLLIPVEAKGHMRGDAMELISLKNPIEVHILLAIHVV
jgi:hypothetical protein